MQPIYSKELRTDYLFLLKEVIYDIIENNRVYDDKAMYLCVAGLKVFEPNSLNYRRYVNFIESNHAYFCSWYLSKGYQREALRSINRGGTFLRTTEICNFKTINNIRFIFINHLYDLLNMDL